MDKQRIKALAATGVVAVLGVWGLTSLSGSDTNTKKTDSASTSNKKTADSATDRAKQLAQKTQDAQAKAAKGENVTTSLDETTAAYEYVAGTGESYTALARQAVAKLDAKLTPAERVAAETKLSEEAGMPYLEIGQRVSMKKEAVGAAVKWAKSLTTQEKASWQYYADQVSW